MNQNIVVMYEFRLIDPSQVTAFVNASKKLDIMLANIIGFQYRTVTLNSEGLWIDLVYWQNEKDMTDACSMNDSNEMKKLMSLIDGDSVVKKQATVLTSACPEMKAA